MRWFSRLIQIDISQKCHGNTHNSVVPHKHFFYSNVKIESRSVEMLYTMATSVLISLGSSDCTLLTLASFFSLPFLAFLFNAFQSSFFSGSRSLRNLASQYSCSEVKS